MEHAELQVQRAEGTDPEDPTVHPYTLPGQATLEADASKYRPEFYKPLLHPTSQSAASSKFNFEHRSCKNTS